MVLKTTATARAIFIVELTTGLLIVFKTAATRTVFVIIEPTAGFFFIVVETASWTFFIVELATRSFVILETTTAWTVLIIETAFASRFFAEFSLFSLSFFVTVTVRNSEGLVLQEFFFPLCRLPGARTLASVSLFCHAIYVNLGLQK